MRDRQSAHAHVYQAGEFGNDGDARRIGILAGRQVGKPVRRAVRQRTVERDSRMTAAAEVIPVAVAREVKRDAVQPRRQGGIAAESPESPVCAHESILRDLLRVGMAAQKSRRESVEGLAVACHDLEERGFVPGAESADQFRIVLRGLQGGRAVGPRPAVLCVGSIF